MGKTIDALARQEGFEVIAKINSEHDWISGRLKLNEADVAIEFTTPAASAGNIRRCFEIQLPVVCGTTGWENEKESIKNECISNHKTLIVAPNFSLGVNIFFMVNRYIAGLMNAANQFDIEIEEIHHVHKLDTPSGTAKELANDLIKLVDRKTSWVNHETNVKSELPVISKRAGEVPGTHIVRYFSAIDEIEIKHSAKSRSGFAFGALLAAKWIKGKTGYFTMDDLMQSMFANRVK